MGMGGNENSPFSHLPPTGRSSDTVNGPLFFCIVIFRRVRLDFTLDVHETLLALTMHV